VAHVVKLECNNLTSGVRDCYFNSPCPSNVKLRTLFTRAYSFCTGREFGEQRAVVSDVSGGSTVADLVVSS